MEYKASYLVQILQLLCEGEKALKFVKLKPWNRIHMLVSIPSKLSISSFMGYL